MKLVGPLTRCRGARPWKARRIANEDRPLAVNLPFGAAVYPTGLSLPSSLAEDQWGQIGDCLCRAHEGVQWALGDWWGFGDRKYGERAAEKRAKNIPYAFGTLMNYGWVARQVEPSLRREDLSFSHHAVVAYLEPDRQRHWLDRAARQKLSVKQLRRSLGDADSNRLDHDELARARVQYDRLLADAQRASNIDPFQIGAAGWEEDDRMDALQPEEVRQLIDKAEGAARAWSSVAEGLRRRLDRRLAQELSGGGQADAA